MNLEKCHWGKVFEQTHQTVNLYESNIKTHKCHNVTDVRNTLLEFIKL